MKIRSLYHKAEAKPVSMAIVGLTWVYALFYGKGRALKYNFSHEEIWVPERQEGNFEDGWSSQIHYKFVPYGECFSSTTRGDAKGVRIAPASEVLHHPERWKWIEFEVDDELFNRTWPDFEGMAERGIDYDFIGATLGFINPHNVQDPSKWYCSELCVFAKSIWGVMKRWMRISPRRSAFEMAKKYHEPKPLI